MCWLAGVDSGATCSSPPALSGRSLGTLTAQQLGCVNTGMPTVQGDTLDMSQKTEEIQARHLSKISSVTGFSLTFSSERKY